MRDETVNGYTNQETFNVAAWQDNDEGFQNRVQEMADNARQEAEHGTRKAERILADALKSMWEEFADPEEAAAGDSDIFLKEYYPMVSDVGSLHRVNWDELAEGILGK